MKKVFEAVKQINCNLIALIKQWEKFNLEFFIKLFL